MFLISTEISYMMREVGDLRRFKAEISTLMFASIFRNFLAQNGRFKDKIREGVVWRLPPVNSFLLLGLLPLWHFGKNRSTNATMRMHADRQIHAQTDKNWLYNLSRAICYSYGEDNNISINVLNLSLLSCSFIQTWNLLPVLIRIWCFFCKLQPSMQHHCN